MHAAPPAGHTAITPQLLQSIRLLQLNAAQLEREVTRTLEENPLLERIGADETVAGHEGNTGRVAASATAVAFDADRAAAETGGFDAGGVRGSIRAQLRLELDDPRAYAVACWILDHTGDAGYLELPRTELCARAAQAFGVSATAVEALRRRILRCEPAGFAAADLRECLTAQLAEQAPEDACVRLAVRIVEQHLPALARGEREPLARALGASAAQLDAALARILALDPKPGLRQRAAERAAIVPDVIVERSGGRWQVALNPAASPRVRLDAHLENLLAASGDSPAGAYLRELLQQARAFVRGLALRAATLLAAARAIVERQSGFLERGAEHMRPLILRDIAQAIGMHESSVSRITSGKFLQTPRGTFELKHFFSAKLDGADVAGAAVRAMVKRLIETEDRAAPLEDDTIASLLARRGVRVARRTVAKYRGMLRIASARRRRTARADARAAVG